MSTPATSLLGKIKGAFTAFATTGLSVITKVLPFISPFLPAPINAAIVAGTGELSAIAAVITNVEAAFANAAPASTPSLKLAAATPQISAIVSTWLTTGLPGGAKVQDQAGFTAGVQALTSAMVQILNSVGD